MRKDGKENSQNHEKSWRPPLVMYAKLMLMHPSMLIRTREAWDLLFETTWVNSLTEASELSLVLPAPFKQRRWPHFYTLQRATQLDMKKVISETDVSMLGRVIYIDS